MDVVLVEPRHLLQRVLRHAPEVIYCHFNPIKKQARMHIKIAFGSTGTTNTAWGLGPQASWYASSLTCCLTIDWPCHKVIWFPHYKRDSLITKHGHNVIVYRNASLALLSLCFPFRHPQKGVPRELLHILLLDPSFRVPLLLRNWTSRGVRLLRGEIIETATRDTLCLSKFQWKNELPKKAFVLLREPLIVSELVSDWNSGSPRPRQSEKKLLSCL